MFQPRFYQTEAINSVYPLKPGDRKLVVIPTGGGKSYVGGRLASDNTVIMGRVLVLVHVQELVVQNSAAVLKADALADLGIVCAGIDPNELSPELLEFLGRLDAEVTVASIQSVYKKLHHWDDVGLILVDEAHRITPVGGKLYRAVMDRFPQVPVIGLTATPFRMGTGMLHKGEFALFHEISYEITLEELVELGYLVPFAKLGSNEAYSDEGLKKVAGEFSQKDLDKLTEDGAKTRRIVKQFVQRARMRKHWLLFAINVRHAKMIKGFLEEEGIPCGVLYDGMEKEGLKREDEIDMFKLGVYRAMVNVNVLTTGFDFPELDCIGLIRPLASIVLYIQCLGRGTRTAPGKVDCLILDYGGNVSRHGDFSKPDVKEAKKGKPSKECGNANCGEMNTQAARNCVVCGFKFTEMFKPCPKCEWENDRSAQECGFCGYHWPVNEDKLDEEGKTIVGNEAVWLPLSQWYFKVHEPWQRDGEEKRPDTVLLTYKAIDGGTVKEYIFPESWAARPKFERFWREHKGAMPIPKTSKEAVERKRELRLPKRIKAIRSGQYYNILAREH